MGGSGNDPSLQAGGACSTQGTPAVLRARSRSGARGRLCEDRPPPSSLVPTVSPPGRWVLLLPGPDGGRQDGAMG